MPTVMPFLFFNVNRLTSLPSFVLPKNDRDIEKPGVEPPDDEPEEAVPEEAALEEAELDDEEPGEELQEI